MDSQFALTVARPVFDLMRPPLVQLPVESASKHLKVTSGASNLGSWSPDLTPYMIDPLNACQDRTVSAVVFVGPARTGKTEALCDGVVCHTYATNPHDSLVVWPTQDMARDYGKVRLPRLLRADEFLRSQIRWRSDDDNVFDKTFVNGARLTISWPSISQLSGREYQTVIMTDYDRSPLDIDGEGSLFVLGSKRNETFLSAGKSIVESSPGHEIDDSNLDDGWDEEKADCFTAPPAPGIAAIYNSGSRHVLHWTCLHCDSSFPVLSKFLDRDSGQMICPHCKGPHAFSDRPELQKTCHWICPDGRELNPIRSYWMQGPAAAFNTWQKLIDAERGAKEAYDRTGDYANWKAVINTSFGMWTKPPTKEQKVDSSIYETRKEEWPKYSCPQPVKFLTAAIDQQKSRFVVQVIGWGENGRENWLIDRYNIAESERFGEDGKRLKIEPFNISEDWKRLDTVFTKEYDGLTPVLVGIDTGGMSEATANAQRYYNYASKQPWGAKLRLLKGNPNLKAEQVKMSSSTDKVIKAPLYLCGMVTLFDELQNMLGREQAGEGYCHFPDWLGSWFFAELSAEKRTTNGVQKWNEKSNNEASDLYRYNLALWYLLGGQSLDWSRLQRRLNKDSTKSTEGNKWERLAKARNG